MHFRDLTQQEIDKIVPPNTVLLGYRGSIAHGMYLDPKRDENGIDDKDVMGTCIAPLDVYLGLKEFEQRETMILPWDSVVYEFRKFVRLLLANNPNVLSMLWLERKHYIHIEPAGQRLLGARRLFSSKRIFKSFTGYAHDQLKKMTRTKFRGYMGAKRKALVEKFGYDTKNAAHLIRLLRMGIEFLNTEELSVEREDAPQLLQIKRGEWTLEQVKEEADRLFKRADDAYDRTKLPNHPDVDKVNEMCVEILADFFGVRWRESLG
jgi:predicted nucleotidyltransferase